jgi:hypothetical protein
MYKTLIGWIINYRIKLINWLKWNKIIISRKSFLIRISINTISINQPRLFHSFKLQLMIKLILLTCLFKKLLLLGLWTILLLLLIILSLGLSKIICYPPLIKWPIKLKYNSIKDFNNISIKPKSWLSFFISFKLYYCS